MDELLALITQLAEELEVQKRRIDELEKKSINTTKPVNPNFKSSLFTKAK